MIIYLELDELHQRLNREIRLWSLLKHNNVVPFVGVSGDFGSLLSPLSIWMPNGILSI